MPIPEEIARGLSEAHAEALRVGDSPLRADRLAERVAALAGAASAAMDPADEARSRLLAALADAERVLRRDDDGREAARHLQGALRLGGPRTRKPSPFLDDD
jgi:hypothetical protein